ncbi:zinc finger BED domain-containing protein RICESLEEPER 2-like [Carya illinoinensis]|uniref:zinc finger BED domain-containing protein RICESLEEPER 2-like n=1 Tax=Carya illinoinensis TaxID=32201 RepID=UPI001C726DE7|nr:zinc finger BED domain-containing protein RICESLEEPER 2-like [Carya illinoinensis]
MGNVLREKYMHMRCCAHILNLVVNEGLKECNDAITIVRNAVRYVRSSPARLEKFKRCAEKEKIDSKKMLSLDVQTRWNSTYIMLEAAENFEKAFRWMESEDHNFLSYFKDGNIGPPRAKEWETVQVFVKFLKMFYDATCRFFGSLYVTANTSFLEICVLQKELVRLSESDNNCLMNMAVSMRIKYDKYWGSLDRMNLMLLIAVVLDPRNLYAEYNDAFSSSSVNSTEHVPPLPSTSTKVSEDNHESQFFAEWLLASSASGSTFAKIEIDRYFSDGCEAFIQSFDLVNWWKVNEPNYPILARIA